MINVLYIHGYGSDASVPSEKIELLKGEFRNVYRIAPDYDLGYESAMKEVNDFLDSHDVDALIGTSMGGYTANHIGTARKMPYVSINPAITPAKTLTRMDMLKKHVDSYNKPFVKSHGLVVVGLKDKVIAPDKTIKLALEYDMHIIVNNDADHRFDASDFEDNLDDMAAHLYAERAYGSFINVHSLVGS